MYGVPVTTSSQVPGTLPVRPEAGWLESCSTALEIRSTVRAAASGLSRAMYSASSSRFLSASLSHLTRTSAPFSHDRVDLLLTCEVASVGFLEGSFDFGDLPFVQFDVGSDCLGCDVGFGAFHRLGEFFEPGFCFAVNADGHYFRHICIVLYTLAYGKRASPRMLLAPRTLTYRPRCGRPPLP